MDARKAPRNFDPSSACVYPDFLSLEESQAVEEDLRKLLKRRRYEDGHWDSVITKYKEIELFDESLLSVKSQEALKSARTLLERQHLSVRDREQLPVKWLPCHAIDLHKNGELNDHVDSVRFSGGLVAGLSLLSTSIMRLAIPNDSDTARDDEDDGHVDLYLPANSLYVLTGVSRYSYGHSLLSAGSTFGPDSIRVDRDRRLSVIFRDAKTD